MSRSLISRNDDLKRLQDEGYEIEIRANHLVINHVPYVTPEKEVDYGMLVSSLELANDVTQKPADHVTRFAGSTPCDATGQPLGRIINSSGHAALAEGLEIDHTFSSKPSDGYRDYHHKMTTYISILAGPARELDPEATAMTFPLITPSEEDSSVFNYIDTASTRAGIMAITERLEAIGPVAIVGLGGTGAYVLDLVAKTPVAAIHLFDGDRFLQHNAFRSPGAPTGAQLEERPQKVNHFAALYAAMHRHIVPHDYFVDQSNVEELRGMSFVFLALDEGAAKRLIVAKLEDFGIPFVDVGMGVLEEEGAVGGLVRTTTSTPAQRDHVHDHHRIPFAEGDGDNDYSRNIQIADLNALNAALAVIRWKKLAGFYRDDEHEHHSLYVISGNALINEEQT